MQCQKCNCELPPEATVCPACDHAVHSSMYLNAPVKINDDTVLVDENCEPAAADPFEPAAEEPQRPASGKARQPREALATAFEDMSGDTQPQRSGSPWSLALSVIIGALLLGGFVAAGLYQLNYKKPADADSQQARRALQLPPSVSPAPTYKETAKKTDDATSLAVQQPAGISGEGSAGRHPTDAPAPEVSSVPAPPAEPTEQQQQPLAEPPRTAAEKPGPERPAASEKSRPKESSGSFELLCGSFQSKDKAQQIVQKLKKDKFAAYVQEADLGTKGTWYRVKIGGIGSRPEAELVREEIKRKLKLDAIVAKKR